MYLWVGDNRGGHFHRRAIILLYIRARSVLNSIKTTSTTIHEISSAVKDEIVRPVAQLVALIRGIHQGIDLVSRFFRKEESEGGRDG